MMLVFFWGVLSLCSAARCRKPQIALWHWRLRWSERQTSMHPWRRWFWAWSFGEGTKWTNYKEVYEKASKAKCPTTKSRWSDNGHETECSKGRTCLPIAVPHSGSWLSVFFHFQWSCFHSLRSTLVLKNPNFRHIGAFHSTVVWIGLWGFDSADDVLLLESTLQVLC